MTGQEALVVGMILTCTAYLDANHKVKFTTVLMGVVGVLGVVIGVLSIQLGLGA